MTLDGELDHGSHLSIVVTSCVFCEEDENLDHHCPFLKGLGVGIASTLYKKNTQRYGNMQSQQKGRSYLQVGAVRQVISFRCEEDSLVRRN